MPDVTKGTYYCSRIPVDGRVNLERMTAKNIYDFIRALTHPYPGAFCYYKKKKLFIWKASLLEDTIKHSPGRICMKKGNGRVVIARDKGLLIESVQLEAEEEAAAHGKLIKGEYLT